MIPGKNITPEAVVQIAVRRLWLIVIPAVIIAAASAAVTHFLPDRFQSDTLILVVPKRVPESYVRSSVTTTIADRLQSISQQILSRTRLEAIIQEFNLYAERRRTAIMEDVVQDMRRDIDVEIVKGDAFRVRFTGDEPRMTMRVTERLASFFIDESLRDRQVLAEDTDQFLESQLADARRRLGETEQKLADYRRRHDGELPTQVDSNMQGLHNAEMQLQALIDSANRDRDRRLVLERMLADASNAELPAAADPAGQDSRSPAEQLRAAEAALPILLQRLTEEHPDVIRLKRSIVSLRAAVEAERGQQPLSALTPAERQRRNRLEELRTEIDNLDKEIGQKAAQENRLRGAIASYQKRIEAGPGRESELSELTRDYDTLQQSYRTLLVKKQESQIATNLERRQIGEQFKVLDPARLPEKPSSPDRPRLYILGILLGVAVGLSAAGASEYLDHTMKSEEDVRLALNLPVLATVPLIEASRSRGAATGRWIAASAAAVVAVAGAAIYAWVEFR